MARWSDAMKLSEIPLHADYLRGFPGVYELGYVRGDWFTPKYIGRARTSGTCLYTRLSSYMRPSCHNIYLREKLEQERHNVWFHVYKSANPAFTEASLIRRHGIGEIGLYSWNQRHERAALARGDLSVIRE